MGMDGGSMNSCEDIAKCICPATGHRDEAWRSVNIPCRCDLIAAALQVERDAMWDVGDELFDIKNRLERLILFMGLNPKGGSYEELREDLDDHLADLKALDDLTKVPHWMRDSAEGRLEALKGRMRDRLEESMGCKYPHLAWHSWLESLLK